MNGTNEAHNSLVGSFCTVSDVLLVAMKKVDGLAPEQLVENFSFGSARESKSINK